MSADNDIKLQSIEEIMSYDGPIDLFATDEGFKKAGWFKPSVRNANKPEKGGKGKEAKTAKKTDGPSKSQPGAGEGKKPVMNMSDQVKKEKELSKRGTPSAANPSGKNITFDPASGEAVYWRGRNFPGNQTDMRDFSNKLRSGEYLPIYIDGDRLVIGSAAGEKESFPISDIEMEEGALAKLLENGMPARWQKKDILGAVPAKQYTQGILPQIIATSGSGKARGIQASQDPDLYNLEDKSSFDNYTVWNYLKNLIRGEEGNKLGTGYYSDTIGDNMNPALLQDALSLPEEEKAGFGGMSDDELSAKYPGMKRAVADLIASGGLGTTEMDSLSGLSGNQFRDALGKLAIKNMLTKEFGDRWQNLRDAATAEGHSRSEAIRGGKRIGEEFHDPTDFLSVDDMIDYLTSMEGDKGAMDKRKGIRNYTNADMYKRLLADSQFRRQKIAEIVDREGVSPQEASKMLSEYMRQREEQRAEDEKVSNEWSDKQLDIGKSGKKSDEIQSKAQKTAAEYFGDDYDTLRRLDFRGDDIQTLKNFRDKHNSSINSAIQKLMRLYGGQLPEKYRKLTEYVDKPLYGKTGEQFPDIDKELSDLITGGADYDSAASQIGAKYKTRNMAQVLSLLRSAINEPGNEDLLRKYNESREAQGARDFNEMFKPKNQREEDIIKAYQEAYQNALDAGHNKEDAQALALEEVNRKQSNLAHGEELPLTPEMIKRMVMPQNQYLAEQQAAAQAEDAAEHAKIEAMNTVTGEEQPHAFAPTKEEALASGGGVRSEEDSLYNEGLKNRLARFYQQKINENLKAKGILDPRLANETERLFANNKAFSDYPLERALEIVDRVTPEESKQLAEAIRKDIAGKSLESGHTGEFGDVGALEASTPMATMQDLEESLAYGIPLNPTGQIPADSDIQANIDKRAQIAADAAAGKLRKTLIRSGIDARGDDLKFKLTGNENEERSEMNPDLPPTENSELRGSTDSSNRDMKSDVAKQEVKQEGGSDDAPEEPSSNAPKQKTDDSESTKKKESENTETKETETPKKEQENVVLQNESKKAFMKSIEDLMNEDFSLADSEYIRTPWNLVVTQTGEPMKIEAPTTTKGSEEHHTKTKLPSISELMDE